MQHLMNPSRTAKALALLDSQTGLSAYAAAKKAGVDVAAVYRALKRRNARKLDGLRLLAEQEIADINAWAEREGWAIFNDCEIQRDDEAGVFAYDADALDFVRSLAAAGSSLHLRALQITDNDAP